MKKIILLITAVSTFTFGHSQNTEKLKEFTASNGITYKIDDEIKLGRGSDTNGNFVYVKMGGWAAANGNVSGLGPGNTGLIVTIKKIKKYHHKRYTGVYFTVGGGNITNYILDIENAILTCEVENCTDKVSTPITKTDKYDQLKKLKELFDDGVLSKEEYDSEKKKILEIE